MCIRDRYDFIVIDCPPSLGLLTLNSLTAADSVLVPVQCEFYALEGLGQLLNTISIVRRTTNPNLEIEGVLTVLKSRLFRPITTLPTKQNTPTSHTVSS